MQAIKHWIKKSFPGIIYREKFAASRKRELEANLEKLDATPPAKLSDASFDVFTYHGEDGIIAYLVLQLKNIPKLFIDIGAGDCLTGNCSNLIAHYGWSGVFIDMNEKKLSLGKEVYNKMSGPGLKLKFVHTEVTPETINDLLAAAGISGDIGLLSIDVDGNDYWIWKAIDIISPAIVVIESKVEYGRHDVIVPYGKNNHRSADHRYNGASAVAFEKLAKKKGYKLAGANKQGYNLFFVKESAIVKMESVADILSDDKVTKCFYPESFFKEHEFVIE